MRSNVASEDPTSLFDINDFLLDQDDGHVRDSSPKVGVWIHPRGSALELRQMLE